jgi:hypothetical protein
MKMLEIASILAAYLSFALLHGAEAGRLPARLGRSLRESGAWRIGARLAASLFFGLSVWLWGLATDGLQVLLVPFFALCLFGCVIVLLRPLRARLVWGAAAMCPPMILLLSIWGGFYGA